MLNEKRDVILNKPIEIISRIIRTTLIDNLIFYFFSMPVQCPQ